MSENDRPTLPYAAPQLSPPISDRTAWIVACVGGVAGGLAMFSFGLGVPCFAPVAGAIVAGAAALSASRRRVRFGMLAVACLVLTATAFIVHRHYGWATVRGSDAAYLAFVLSLLAGVPGFIVSMAIGIARVDPSEFEPGPGAR